ncbi:hypothetical protein [uncultured Rikenella sp.]|uniref:hypothetical protein n=1 Tax=uncultured Rikenella sp. TaxID=368003 RepID=UPI0026090D9E|nr:hypothetical protein [uncultured Rikenella sp.]
MSSLPAPGYRNNRTGASGFVGCSGYSWSSSCDTPNSRFVDFTPAYLNPSNLHPRAVGFQLRCLSE